MPQSIPPKEGGIGTIRPYIPDQDDNCVSRLTIIIPLFYDTPVEAFEETLASVLMHKPEEAGVLIANGTEYADPWNTAREGVDFLALQKFSNPVDILNEALCRASGDVFNILWPGTEVTPNWFATALVLFEKNPEVGIVIPSVFDRRKPKRVFSFGIHYKPEGVLRTIRRSRWAEASGKTVVPHISAVFFRAGALSNSALLDRTFIPQIAYADLAMTVSEQNWTTVVDQKSRVMVRPNHLPTTSPFTWGLQAERLYFRWFGENSSIFSLGKHFGSFFADFWRHFPRLKAYQIISGRLFGLLFFGEMLPFVRRSPKKPVRKEPKNDTPLLTRLPCNEQDVASSKKSA